MGMWRECEWDRRVERDERGLADSREYNSEALLVDLSVRE